MCGGVGTRLWPASQAARPKQFLRLTGTHTMFQQTVLRVAALAATKPLVIGNIQHADAIESQLLDIGVSAKVPLEPCVRDSAPLVADAAKRSVRDGERDGQTLRLAASFESAPRISLDYAVMEKTDRAAVLPVDFFWSDLGAWNAVHDACAKDAASNAVSGDSTLINSERCFVRNETNLPVAAIGVSDLVILAEPSGILVCDLSASQAVKSVAEKLSVGRRNAAAQPAAKALADWASRYEHWLLTAALPLWWSLGADHELGGFHELIDLDGTPKPAPRRARVQTRQSIVYAEAHKLGWQGPSREATLHCMRFFRANYLREDGLFRTLVDGHGRELDNTATLYDQAFALP